MKKLDEISRESIRGEWDKFAKTRHEIILGGKDISYTYVLIPIIKRLIRGKNSERIVDIGCGTGILTKDLSSQCKEITGIDPSKKSIDIARNYCKEQRNIFFESCFVEDYNVLNSYDLAISNMVLMDAANIEKVISSVANLVEEKGYFIFTITHPCFWPIYWGYFKKPWFNYYQEIPINNTFNITNQKTVFKTTHFHRPLNIYMKYLNMYGFDIEEVREPYPDWSAVNKENANYSYPYPRFLAFSCKKRCKCG